MIIDSHAHIFPQKINQIATDAIGGFYNYKMRHTGDPEELIASGARAGVTKFVVFSTATTPAQVEKINSYIMEQLSLHPEFIGA
ncbi:MAG: hypothetical protein LBQ91_07010, partial [Oscillospiraceae bacterium]|nr:hypothetical protein [Oscillospiraceae bacterium]